MGDERPKRNANRFRSLSGLALGLILLMAFSTQVAAQAPVTVKLWNWSIHDKKYQQKMYKLFNQRHPEIRIEYSSISSGVYEQTLEAAFIAQDPPDLFIPNGKMSFNYLKAKGLVRPLSEVAPTDKELKDWMAQYPQVLNKFVEGVSLFNGKPYIVDLAGEYGEAGIPLNYNKTLFGQAGLARPPATQSELRQFAAKITQVGAGKFFGITHGQRYRPGAWHQDLAGSLAWQANGEHLGLGGPSWGPSRRDGRYHAGSPEFITAMTVWIGMRTDGSVFPGETTMDDEQAKMAFATNKAALFFGGWWVPGNVLAYNPDADFDVVLPPTPDDGIRRAYYNVSSQGGAFGYVVSSAGRNPHAVWGVIRFISSEEYQTGYVQGGFGVSYLPAANKPENFTVPQMYRYVQWSIDPTLRRVAPAMPAEAVKVWSTYAPGIYPLYEDVLDNVYQGKSGLDALKDLDARCDAALDEGIRKAQAEGITVTRADFSFPDWDPSKDYAPKK